jgi:hypothetical protein
LIFEGCFLKYVDEIQVSLKSDKVAGTLHEDVFTFLTISRLSLLRMKNVSDESCRENQNTHFMLINFFFENGSVYEIMSKNEETEATDNMVHARCVLEK